MVVERRRSQETPREILLRHPAPATWPSPKSRLESHAMHQAPQYNTEYPSHLVTVFSFLSQIWPELFNHICGCIPGHLCTPTTHHIAEAAFTLGMISVGRNSSGRYSAHHLGVVELHATGIGASD